MALNFLSLIESKRDGQELSPAALASMVQNYGVGRIPDYQMAAMLMAIFFRGLTEAETRHLTLSMRDSGLVLEFPNDSRPLVDKHSTGGVGDKVSLVLAPLLACLGFRVPMISGRGLGLTGGTLDKLESIPGFTTQLDPLRLVAQVQRLGVAMAGQSAQMIPADQALYALRDVTGTVPSLPLITASILSKKLAENLDALIMDVKVGRGAFMKSREQAVELARTIVTLSTSCGMTTRALLTDMNIPLGRSAGHWLEVKESVECLESRGPDDLKILVVECAAHLLVQTGLAPHLETARARAVQCLASGQPRAKWDELLLAQGADLKAFQQKLTHDHTAPVVVEVKTDRAGIVNACDARIVGEVLRDLGGGRLTKESAIDHDVGADRIAKPGDAVETDSILCRIHARRPDHAAEATRRIQKAFAISDAPSTPAPLLLEVIESN